MSVASKNLFDLLGNDPEEEPQLPVQPVDKTAARHGKRVETAPKDAGPAPTPAARGGRGGRRGDNQTGSERAYQDRDAGRSANRGRTTEERAGGRGRGGRGRGEGRGRGGRGGNFDRHSRTGVTDSDKQASKGWGEESGVGELRDEQAGDAQAADAVRAGVIADSDAPRNAEGELPATENGTGEAAIEAEPQEKQKTLADWQAEQEEKKRALGANLSIRKANEGVGKEAPEGKTFERDANENYFLGGGGKAKRDRERKDRSNQLVLEHDYATREAPSTGRGGRGGAAGERGRGRGGRGDGFRGQRGVGRGGRGGPGASGASGASGAVRGARGGVTPNISDTGAFPTLGS